MSYFETHWRNAPLRHPAVKLAGARHFLGPLGVLAGSIPLRVLDAGCGDAVHATAIAETHHAVDYVGVDIAETALHRGRILAPGGSGFVAADLVALPFRSEFFDVVISFGAIAYTTDPARSFRELCRVLRPGGLLGIWVYPHRAGLAGLLFSLVRRLCRLSGPWATNRIADAIVPLLALLPTHSGMSLANASWAECREVVLVNIAPETLVFPRPVDVAEWFDRSGLERIAIAPMPPVTIWGQKRPASI